MGSTYLDLTNRVLRRLNEVELSVDTFDSARGIHAVAKDAVLDTVRKINSQKFEWPFNAAVGTQVLTIGQEEYPWPSNLRVPDWDSFYIESDVALNVKNLPLTVISKEQWWKYLRSDDFNAGATGLNVPRCVFATPNGGFGVTRSPDKGYTVKYTYFIKTIVLSTATDVCTIPDEYDTVTLDGSLWYMYIFLDNSERAAMFEKTYRDGLESMRYLLIPNSPEMVSGMFNTGDISRSVGYYYSDVPFI